MCYWPKLIQNKKYVPNKKNGYVLDYEKMARPEFDKRVMAVPIGCGECMECRKAKASEWQVRLMEDVRANKNGKFVTLTFSNESIKELAKEVTQKETRRKVGERTYINKNGKLIKRYIYEKTTTEIVLKGYETDNAIATLAVRRFNENWRKKYKKAPRHWLVTELGHNGTENIHLHGIVWTDEEITAIKKAWKYGFTWIGEKNIDTGKIENYVNEKTVNYIIKYVNKMDFDHKHYKPKILTSAGIGRAYTERRDFETIKYQANGKTQDYYSTRTGHTMSLPIYYRNKRYSDEEREKLWLEKLDKQERYVGGEKINVSTREGEEIYFKTLKFYREKNIRLGYNNGTKDWDRKKYEEERRNLMMQKRIGEINDEPDWVNEEYNGEYNGDEWLYN